MGAAAFAIALAGSAVGAGWIFAPNPLDYSVPKHHERPDPGPSPEATTPVAGAITEGSITYGLKARPIEEMEPAAEEQDELRAEDGVADSNDRELMLRSIRLFSRVGWKNQCHARRSVDDADSRSHE
jgi:hypothetical protein